MGVAFLAGRLEQITENPIGITHVIQLTRVWARERRLRRGRGNCLHSDEVSITRWWMSDARVPRRGVTWCPSRTRAGAACGGLCAAMIDTEAPLPHLVGAGPGRAHLCHHSLIYAHICVVLAHGRGRFHTSGAQAGPQTRHRRARGQWSAARAATRPSPTASAGRSCRRAR